MADKKNIKIGDATLSPEMIAVLETWTGKDEVASQIISMIDESKDGLIEILSDYMLEEHEDFKKILICTLRMLVQIRSDLKHFDLSEGGLS